MAPKKKQRLDHCETDSEPDYFPLRRIRIRKMSASKFPPEFKKLVNILVDEVSQIMIYGSRYLEFFWRSVVEEHKRIEEEEKIIANIFYSIYNYKNRSLEFSIWKELGGSTVEPKSPLIAIRGSLDYSIKSYITILDNFDKLALPHHIALTWEAMLFDEITSDINSIEEVMRGRRKNQWRKKLLHIAMQLVESGAVESDTEILLEFFGRIRYDWLVSWSVGIEQAKQSHFATFSYRLLLLKFIETAETEHPGIHFKKFPLLPMYDYSRKFIRIDNTIVQFLWHTKLFKDILPKKFIQKQKDIIIRQKLKILETSPVDKYISSRFPDHLDFLPPSSVLTNGIQLHIPVETILYIKKKEQVEVDDDTVEEVQEESPKKPKMQWIPRKKRINALKNSKIFVRHHGIQNSTRGLYSPDSVHELPLPPVSSVDPGECNIYAATVMDAAGNRIHSRMTRGEYYWNIGTIQTRRRNPKKFSKVTDRKKRKRKRRRGWIPDTVRCAEQLCCTHSLKTSRFSDYRKNLSVQLMQSKILFGFYGSKNQCRNQWYKDKLRDKTFYKILNDLNPTHSSESIIAFGDGYKGHRAWKGTQFGAAPVKSIRNFLSKHCRVVQINEYLTSQKHQVCHTEDDVRMRKITTTRSVPKKLPGEGMTAWRRRRNQLKGDARSSCYQRGRTFVRGVMYCTQCHKSVDRDYNASDNILQVFLQEWSTHTRPRYLCKIQEIMLATTSA